jgi:hypothetical protein
MDKPTIEHSRVNIFLIIRIKLLSRQSFAKTNLCAYHSSCGAVKPAAVKVGSNSAAIINSDAKFKDALLTKALNYSN